jgi:hypothetical protein
MKNQPGQQSLNQTQSIRKCNKYHDLFLGLM